MPADTPTPAPPEDEGGAPACVMAFNAADASGAGGNAGDVATMAAMGAHALPVTTTILMRDTAEVSDQHPIDADALVEQARILLEDLTVAGFKVGFCGSAENVTAVAEILSDYTDVPAVAYLPNLAWMDDDPRDAYQDALRELIVPATQVLVGSHQALCELLVPDWEGERAPSARELAVAAAELGGSYVLVTGVMLPAAKGAPQYMDNILAGPQGAISGEKFELFEVTFTGAGDTLSAALAALLAVQSELQAAVSEALQFLDQSLDAGFQPGMGHVLPDRFFWALPPDEEEEADNPLAQFGAEDGGGPTPAAGGSHRVH